MSETPSTRPRCREFTPADRAPVLDVVETVYGAEFRANFDALLDWQYLDNPYRPEGELCSLVVEEAGAVVGFMGFYYSPTQVGRTVWPSAWILGFVTHPDSRGAAGPRFVREASRTLDRVPLLLGNPGPHIMRFWSWFRAGICTTGPIMIRPFDLAFLLTERFPGPLGSLAGWATRVGLSAAGGVLDELALARARRRGVTVETVSSFGPDVEGLWRRVRRDHPNATARDREYLNWRYVRCPLGPYALRVARLEGEAVGYGVFRTFVSKRMRKGTVVDFLAVDDDPVVTRALLAEGARFFRGERVSLAYAIGPCQVATRHLQTIGFMPRWDDVGGTRHVMGRANVEGLVDPVELFDDRRWYVSFGDADYDLVNHLL